MKKICVITAIILFSLFLQTPLSYAAHWNRVYLATYPRSGNHWMRYLIEEATHIATSSVYRDPDPWHLRDPFPWGGYCVENGYTGHCRYPEPYEAVVIKTHFPAHEEKQYDNQPSIKTIRIIRHPVDSIYSYYLYLHGNRPPSARIEDKPLKNYYIHTWRKFQEYWNREKNIVSIRFEDLYNDPKKYLRKVLDAIGYPATDDDIERAVAKHPPQGGLLKHLHRFTDQDLALIEYELRPLLKQCGYTINGILYKTKKPTSPPEDAHPENP